jgi:hypothetical protein
VLIVASLSVILQSCDDNRSAGPTPTPAPQLSRIQLFVPPTLSAIGDTVKISLTAFYTDGTSRDVATEAAWTVTMPAVLRVTKGEATALSFGATYVSARFASVNSMGIRVQVTPPGTFAVLGGTREPGMSGLPGVRVTNPASGSSTVTEGGGLFTLGALTEPTLLVQKAGYEDSTYTIAAEDFPWLAMQPLIRAQAGDTISVRIAPHDMDYTPTTATGSSERCSPCKRIRVSNTPGTRLRVTMTWTPVAMGLRLWTEGGIVAPTSPGGLATEILSNNAETWLYVGQNPATATLQYSDVQLTITKPAP